MHGQFPRRGACGAEVSNGTAILLMLSSRWAACASGHQRTWPGAHSPLVGESNARASAARGGTEGGGADIGWRAAGRVRFAGGVGIERFGAGDGRRVEACYEIYRATR